MNNLETRGTVWKPKRENYIYNIDKYKDINNNKCVNTILIYLLNDDIYVYACTRWLLLTRIYIYEVCLLVYDGCTAVTSHQKGYSKFDISFAVSEQ